MTLGCAEMLIYGKREVVQCKQAYMLSRGAISDACLEEHAFRLSTPIRCAIADAVTRARDCCMACVRACSPREKSAQRQLRPNMSNGVTLRHVPASSPA